ncbi:MAG: alkaline phosphatase [Saprospiraceae bacterium]|nr:alkaline phosphatase [Saprospiraceae bacterium]
MKRLFKWTIFFLSTLIIFHGCSPKVVAPVTYSQAQPDNIILMIGDGMGLAHITAHVLQSGSDLFKDAQNVGLVQTFSADNIVTDSGAGATAMSTGYKALNNSVGQDEKGVHRKTIMETAYEAGMKTGIVTTSSILDATPAAFYAHQDNRYYIDSIARDLMNCKVDIIVGGGKQYFDGTIEGSPFNMTDFKKRGRSVSHIWDVPINQWDVSGNGRKIYFNGVESAALHSIGTKHLEYASKAVLEYLSKQNKQFFLMIEGAQIDWASHAGKSDELFLRMESFENAIRRVLKFIKKNKNTLLLITADHATGGLSIIDGSEHENMKLDFSTNGHTGTMVPIFAYGPGADLFRGVMDNTDIYKKMAMLLNLTSMPTNRVSAN